jgi:hypothetical protein
MRPRFGTARRQSACVALAGLALACSAVTARAQAVVVTNVPRNSTVELVRDDTVVASTTASAEGVARVAVPEASRVQQDIDGLLFVDVCGDNRRVLIVQRSRQAAPLEPGCTREEIPGLYLIRGVSTLSIDASVSPPRLLLRQGSFDPTRPARAWALVPIGFVFSAGAGLDMFSDPKASACGNVADCSDDGIGTTFTGGVAFWPMNYVGAEVMYVRPRQWNARGAGDDFTFTDTLDAELLTVGALAGGPVGPTRIYGRIGGSYHRATRSMTETIDEQTITVDDVTYRVQGGTTTLAYRTQGWGWMFGGGLELWLSRYVGVYGDVTFAQLRGSDSDGGEAAAQDRVTTLVGGVKINLRLR